MTVTSINQLTSQKSIGIGTAPNDGTGDTLKAGAIKINDNFADLYAAVNVINKTATTSNLGVVYIDDNTMNVETDGKISVNVATSSVLGAVKTGLTSPINSSSGIAINPAGAISTNSSLIPYSSSYTGSVTRSIADKLNDSISIFDFMSGADIASSQSASTVGAAPDITTAITNAIASVPVSIFIPAGRYKLSSTVSVNSNLPVAYSDAIGLAIIGEGAGKSIIHWVPSNLSTPMFNIISNSSVEFSNLNLQGPILTTSVTISGSPYSYSKSACTNGGSAITFAFPTHINDKNPLLSYGNIFTNLVINAFYHGIDLYNQQQAFVNNCKFTNNLEAGVHINNPFGYTESSASTPVKYNQAIFQRLNITDNLFEYGYGMDSTSPTSTGPVRAPSVTPCGILHSNGGGVIISNNNFVNLYYGIKEILTTDSTSLISPYSFIITDNLIQNGQYGFYFGTPLNSYIYGSYYTIVGNNFTTPDVCGIYIGSGSEAKSLKFVNICSNSFNLNATSSIGIQTSYVKQLAISSNAIIGTSGTSDSQIGIELGVGTFDFAYNNNFFTQINTNVSKDSSISNKNGQSAIIAKDTHVTGSAPGVGNFFSVDRPATTIPAGRFDAGAVVRINGALKTTAAGIKTISVSYGPNVVANISTSNLSSTVTISKFELMIVIDKTITNGVLLSSGYGSINGQPDSTPTTPAMTSTNDYNTSQDLKFTYSVASGEIPTLEYYTVEIIS